MSGTSFADFMDKALAPGVLRKANGHTVDVRKLNELTPFALRQWDHRANHGLRELEESRQDRDPFDDEVKRRREETDNLKRRDEEIESIIRSVNAGRFSEVDDGGLLWYLHMRLKARGISTFDLEGVIVAHLRQRASNQK